MELKGKKIYTRYPEEVKKQYYENGFITFELYSKNRDIRSKKILCKLRCIACDNEDLISTKALGKRALIKEPVCRKCVMGVVTSNPEWLNKNSEAQKKIQSTPEQKLKNAMGVSRFWKNNPDIKKIISEKASKRYQDDLEYRRKINEGGAKNPFSLKGEFFFRKEEWIKFESSYELCFLVWAEKNNKIKKIIRCNFSIEYHFCDKTFNYFPDYITIYDDEKVLTEIKSKRNIFFLNKKEKEMSKIPYAEKFVKENNLDRYDFISEDHDLADEISFKRSCGIRKMCKELYYQGIMRLSSKNHTKRYIGVTEDEDSKKDH